MAFEPTFELIKVEYDTKEHFWRGLFLNNLIGPGSGELTVSISDTKTSRDYGDRSPGLSQEAATRLLREKMKTSLKQLIDLSQQWPSE